jgi:hypothetical protein
MKARAEELTVQLLPQSTLGRAVCYLLDEYDALRGYLRDGRFEIDNNLIYAARGINKVMPTYKKFQETHPAPAGRLYLGRAEDGSVGLKLKDAGGLDRIVMEVMADGSPAIRFLDTKGNVVCTLPSDPSSRDRR